MIDERYKNHTNKFQIDNHPKFIKNKLQNLNKEQFGFDLFGIKNKKFLFQNPKFFIRQLRIKQKYSLFNLN